MPKETFFNLPAQKQQRIIDTATREFANRGFQKCSVQEIASKAGIAKGSIYQYFDSKKELFFYILDIAGSKKVKLLAKYVEGNSNLPFFELIEAMFVAAIKFSTEHPELFKIYKDIQHKAPDEIREEFNNKVNSMGRQHYNILLQEAVQKGEIRSDISTDLAAFVLYILLRNFSDFLFDQDEMPDWDKSKDYVKQFIKILKNGLEA